MVMQCPYDPGGSDGDRYKYMWTSTFDDREWTQ